MALTVGPRVAMFKRRFHAWWDGYEYVEAVAGGASDAAGNAAAPPTEDRWTADRIRIAELIWGDGFNFPGGAEAVLDLVKSCELKKDKTLLELGCGLGGGARAIAKTLGAAVEGLEPSPTLAAEALKAGERSGLGKMVVIQPFDPATAKLPAKSYDAILARHVVGLVGDKSSLLDGLGKSLKPGAPIMIIEYALATADADGPEIRAWREVEDASPAPPTVELIAEALKREKVDVRAAEDLAPALRSQILAGWARLAEEIKGKNIGPADKPLLVRELDLWARRIAALDSGQLKLALVSGVKKG